VRPLLADSRFQTAGRREIARIAQIAVEFPPMQEQQASISQVKATDREGDAARAEISFSSVAYHQPRPAQASKFEFVSTTILPGMLGLPVPPSLLVPPHEVIE
jgi:hypothetical protein